MITVRDDTIHVQTKTLTATLHRGVLTRLVGKLDGAEYVRVDSPRASALKLVYANQGSVDVVGSLAGTVTAHRLSDHAAEFRLHGWDADGVIGVREDREAGDLVVEPAAASSRPGVLAVRWSLPGVRPDLDLVAPFFQGVWLKQNDPLLERRWFWPHFWEAGLAILQGKAGGFWVHCQDDRYRYKALDIHDGLLGFETDAYGPVDNSLGAGGLAWRINVHQGGWEVPAGAYREWLWNAYGLEDAVEARKPWVRDIRFAVSWYNGDPAILDALARRLDPKTVLLHYSDWRTDAYDENYPTYEPSGAARAVFARANAMGFHVMPHCNSVDMDPTHPAYTVLRDFQYRDVQTKGLLGWGWDPATNNVLGVPNSNGALASNRARKVMIKVHPGLSIWRSILAERIRGAAMDVATDTVFIDVTLCSFNLHNCLVENTTSSEGMKRLIAQIAETEGGLAVGGEGLNEVTMQGLSFAQAHLFASWQASADGLERTGGCALNDFLFGRVCRTFGYSGLSGRNEAEALRMRIHREHNAIPTVTIQSAEEIDQPNEAVRGALDTARS